MEQIIIRVRDKAKAKALLDLSTALDFVDSVQSSEVEEGEKDLATQEEPVDFFSFAGIWQDRDVSLESIGEKAWLRPPVETGV